jgi:hypothetical protein
VIGGVIWVAALAWLLYRQVQRRPIGRRGPNGQRSGRRQIAIVLLLVGAIQFVSFARNHHFDATSIGILCLSFLIGAGLGVARGFTVRLWSEDGQLFRQGTAVTVALWLVAVGLHLGSERLIQHAGGPGGVGSASMLLYLGLALTVQTRVLQHRVRTKVTALRGEHAPAAAV